jgi:hypothetical protein
MTTTREMLDASPIDVPFDVAEVAAAIDACLDCSQACVSDADADLVEPDVAEMRTCIALCLNCADLCDTTARFLSRPAQWDHFAVNHLLRACVRVCTTCPEECARHADHHAHCAACEKTCRACIQACSALLDAEALEELQKLGEA